MKQFRLRRSVWTLRGLGCLALALAVPTLGTALILGVGLALTTVFSTSFGDSAAASVSAIILGMVFGMIAAVAIALGAYRTSARVLSHRIPWGSVTLGEDGLCVRSFRRRRFVPWAEVTGIARLDGDRAVRVSLRTGSPLELPVDLPEVAAESMHQHARRFRSRTPATRLRVLDESAGDPEAWMKRATQSLQATQYRVEGTTPEALAELAEDPTQTAAQRLGAALALRDAGPDLKQRVRVATESSARPGLAEAMEAALEGELDAQRIRRLLAE
ncbi:MAG: PH domain-containing protein [Polyangiaceae bacterium]